jgi:hypothetical protein
MRKKDYLWPHEFANYQAAEMFLQMHLQITTISRIHSSLGYDTPDEFTRSGEKAQHPLGLG